MEKRKLKRIIRTRHLTPEEVARDQEIRRKVQEEFPPKRDLKKEPPTANQGTDSRI
jgi:hypothetical protein